MLKSSLFKAKKISSRPFATATVKNYVNGEFVNPEATTYFDVVNSATQEVISKVPQSTESEFNAAVANAKAAFNVWKDVPVSQRARFMFDF